jgi:hypothetical protein
VNDLLRIYLQDHLAGAGAGLALARRAAASNSDSEFGDGLARIADAIDRDREELLGIMDMLGVGRDRLKELAAQAGERAGRLKLNGRLTSYSPLSRLVEIEGLMLGVSGKRSLWRVLETLAPEHGELDEAQLTGLAARAERQREELEQLRLAAAKVAFGAPAA